MLSDSLVYVAGHRGLVGSAVWRALLEREIETVGWSSAEVDLRNRDAAFDAVLSARPQVMVMAAALVGGIMANATHPVDFLNDNLRIQTNLFEAAHAADVERVVFLGSSCIYPKLAPQPIPESALLTGPLEPTNQAYAIAKIAGIEAVNSYREQYNRRWISVMPTNLYGPGDNFDLNSSHVLPAMIRKFHDADDVVTLWGTGTPRREFLHSDDAASAILHLIEHYDGDQHVNIGTGEDISIRELAALVAEVVGFDGRVEWDTSKPDGTPRKLLDVSRLKGLGWAPRIGLRDGVAATCEWFTASRQPPTPASP
ncbi:MAG: GDP-L-fucose synthase [Actinobacteria bacterium]|nr:GDP-L-fucose synthase [Actinomycetota bacterium]MCB9414394.1 GDP-L-fucose synthase [Actinomycetota bacterium]MCB9424316.1 GDP-L-fucose synthase [Actinomycetota bacterium]HRY08811.1 GDP-L-fucose synthase [Candidatus Nanopelagicales bacterium]